VLYNNVANNMFEYDPTTTGELAQKTLDHIKAGQNSRLYVSLCTKMIDGAMAHGDFLYAMDLTHDVLSSLENASIDPSSPDFNMSFLLMSILYVKILFNIGAFEDCLDIGYNILNVLDDTKINSINYSIVSKEEFKYLVNECVAYIAIVDVITMKEDVGEFLNISKKLLTFIPESYSIFVQLQNLIKGQNAKVSQNMIGNNEFSAIIYHIVNAFTTCNNSPDDFAREVYKAKLIAKESELFSFELFADLMIGYAYIQLNSFKKASSMIYKIIKYSKEKGMNAVEHIAWYVMSILNIKEGKYDIAYGVLNNSEISMEKNGQLSEYLSMLNKVNMYKVLMCTNKKEQAQLCLNQASAVVQKYGLNFNLNIDIKKILLENSVRNEAEQNNQETAPIPQEQRVSEGNNPEENSISETDSDVVDPSEFFSE